MVTVKYRIQSSRVRTLHRPASPLLHDYKPSVAENPKKFKALQWFAIGLGLPLLGLALLNGLTTSNDTPVIRTTPSMTASQDDALISSPEVDFSPDASANAIIAEVIAPPEPEYDTITLTIRSGDTLDKIFRANKLDLGHLAVVSRLAEAKARFRKIKPGDTFEITHDEGQLVSMYTSLSLTSALSIERGEEGFTAQIVDKPIEKRRRYAYGVIENSLYESAATAGLSDKLIMNIAGIFAWDVDFVLDIRGGDNYYVQYEEIWQDGKFITDGEIIVAEFNNNGRTSQAVRFIDETGRADYFTPDGHSVRKAFLRSPVDFRVSSSFNPNRRHPVLKTVRPHRGTDYAAPAGTPIKASGDGKVIFRGVKSGYGNVVILQHGGNITTLYAHMSKFASKSRLATRVRQGQTIGYVGKTGLVTGVHLHYEYRLNGVHRNSRTVKLPQADPIQDKYRQQFLADAKPVLLGLEQYKRTQVASVTYSE
jgi:murein DD-endopeptidase MepM/ murein hydrolase activator NlpD